MSTLLLRLAGPMQAWGDASRFTRRDTRPVPTKSGVLGLLAAAEGRRRADPIEDLLGLRFGVRADQPGTLQRDFQTAINWESGAVMPLSDRYYVADAIFVAAVEGDRALLEGLADAVRAPKFALYLGRRSCPTTDPVFLDLVEEDLDNALSSAPWQAGRWYRRRQPTPVAVEWFTDAEAGGEYPVETRRDVPVSFNPERREYAWREVAHRPSLMMDNPDGWRPRAAGLDWFDEVVGA